MNPTAPDAIAGSDGDDTLNGGDGNNVIWGGAGADMLTGGNGTDFIFANGTDQTTGGPGADTFFVDVSGFPGPLPTITDYNPAQDDSIRLFTSTQDFNNFAQGFWDQITNSLLGVQVSPQFLVASTNNQPPPPTDPAYAAGASLAQDPTVAALFANQTAMTG
ncbi:MAG: hypothetical protein ACJ8AW_43940 [Rhodopila sp.]